MLYSCEIFTVLTVVGIRGTIFQKEDRLMVPVGPDVDVTPATTSILSSATFLFLQLSVAGKLLSEYSRSDEYLKVTDFEESSRVQQ